MKSSLQKKGFIFGSGFQRDSIHHRSRERRIGVAAGTREMAFHPHTGSGGSEQEVKRDCEPQSWSSSKAPLPGGSISSPSTPPAGNRMFRSMSLWGHFSFQPQYTARVAWGWKGCWRSALVLYFLGLLLVDSESIAKGCVCIYHLSKLLHSEPG